MFINGYATVIRYLAGVYYGDVELGKRPPLAEISTGLLRDLRAYFGDPIAFDSWDRWLRANNFEASAQMNEKKKSAKMRKDPNDVFALTQILLHEANGAPALLMPWQFAMAVSAIEVDGTLKASSLVSKSVPDTIWVEFSDMPPDVPTMPWLKKCLGLLVSRIVIFDDPARIDGFRVSNRQWTDDTSELLVTLIEAAVQGARCVGYRIIVAMRQDNGIRFVPVTVGEDSDATVRSMLAGVYFVTERDARATKNVEQVFANLAVRLLLLTGVRGWFGNGMKEIEIRSRGISEAGMGPGRFDWFQGRVRITYPPNVPSIPFLIERFD